MKLDGKPMWEKLYATVLPMVVVVAFFTSGLKASAANVTLKWDASPSLNVTNYTIYYGTAPGIYAFTNNVSTNLTATLSNLTVGTRYYFIVTAKDSIGLESDPSNEIPFTGGNTWPTISDILNQAVISGASSGPIAFTIGDGQTAPEALILSKESSNQTLVPPNSIVFGGSGANRMVTVTPVAGGSGSAMITVSVSDGELTTSTNVLVTVAPPASGSSVQVISPAFGTMVYEGASVLLAANATSFAAILRAEFFEGTTKLGEDSTPPYSFRVFGLTQGIHHYSVQVVDSLDQTNTSAVISVWVIPVSTVPTVYLRSPMVGGNYVVADNLWLSSEAFSSGSTITKVEFYEGTNKLGESASSPYEMTVSNVLVGVHSYTARAFAADGSVNDSATNTINVGFITSGASPLSSDKVNPTLAVVNAVNNSRTTNASVVVRGTARDNLKLAQVIYSINGGLFRAANGKSNWTVSANLLPGTNLLKFVGLDFRGNHSVTNVRTLFYVVTNGITLRTNGAGTIGGVINRQLLELGRSYQAMAIPRPGNLFSNWTVAGVEIGTKPSLNFLMSSNLSLQANFVTNSFIARKGVYTGLAYDPNNVTFTKAGLFRLVLTDSGAFSGNIMLAGGTFPFTGRFGLDGKATIVIARSGQSSLTIQPILDLVGNSGIGGNLTDGVFTVPLQADRAAYSSGNPTPHAGRYTIIIPGSGEVAGTGIGTLKMEINGSAILGGLLADGTVMVRAASVNRDGWWPMYVPLYTGKGMLISWVQFDTNGTKSLNGDAVWTKNPVPGRYYTNGISLLTAIEGGQYVAPAGLTNRVMNLTDGTVSLTGGNLGTAINEAVELASNNVLTITGTNGLKLTINKENGMVNGSFTHPDSKKITAIKAVVQQGQTNIQGFFLGTNQSGRVSLLP